MLDELTPERVAECWAKLEELGFKRVTASLIMDDGGECLALSECRDLHNEIVGKSGRFRTVKSINNSTAAEVLESAGFLGPDEDEDLVADSLDSECLYVIVPPDGYEGETGHALVFEFDEDSPA